MASSAERTTRVTWQTPRIPREVLRDLNEKRDVIAWTSMILRLALQLLLLMSAWLLLEAGMLLFAIPVILANGALWFFMGWAGIGHELFHGTVFSSKNANRFFFRVFSIITWSNYGYFEYSHWRHHQVALFPDDPELPNESPLALRHVPWYLTVDVPDLWRKVRILSLNSMGVVPPSARISAQPTESQRQVIVKSARVVLTTQLLSFAAFALWQPLLILLVTLAPFTFTLLGRILETAQHAGMERSVNDFRRNSRTVLVAKPLAAAYANMNYHLEHHMYPSIPYYNLPRVRNRASFGADFWPTPVVGFRAVTMLAFGRARD